jgi:hypothetical protein
MCHCGWIGTTYPTRYIVAKYIAFSVGYIIILLIVKYGTNLLTFHLLY